MSWVGTNGRGAERCRQDNKSLKVERHGLFLLLDFFYNLLKEFYPFQSLNLIGIFKATTHELLRVLILY